MISGDSLLGHSGYAFSTKDRDHDTFGLSCAYTFHGAWWYSNCHSSNLNGLYHQNDSVVEYAKGIIWYSWMKFNISLKATTMKTRPAAFKPGDVYIFYHTT